jgi:TP901 family phage tail tape measure protein
LAKGSNDLNMLLKAQVVKVRVELDVPNSMPKIRKQVGEITKKLADANQRVKIKVELDATIKNLQKQFKDIQTKIGDSKTVKPIKLQVQIDVAGSAKVIKDQLKDVYKTVQDFNTKYAQQIKKMQQQAQQAGQKVVQGGTKVAPTTSPIGGFDYKLYVQQVKDAEKLMRSTFGKSGTFASFEMRDAKGNLQGFTAQLEKANGVVQKIQYQWNAEASKFSPINQQTINTMQKNLQKAEMALKSLQAEMFKLGDGAGKDGLLRHYNDLEKRIGNGTLTQNAVKDLQRMIKEEQVLQSQIDKTNKEYIERQKLTREVRNARNKNLNADNNFDIKPYNELLKAIKAGTKSVAEQRLEYQKLEDVQRKEAQNQKDILSNTKKRMQVLQQLRNIERNTISSDETSQRLIREIKLMAQRSNSAKDWVALQKRMNSLQNSNNNAQDLQRINMLQDKVTQKVREYSQMTAMSTAETRKLENAITLTAQRGYKDLERMFYSWKKQLDDLKRQHKDMANQSKTMISSTSGNVSGVNFTDFKQAISRGEINRVQEYVEKLYGARVETVKVQQAKDSLGRSVDRLQVKMAGAGKTVRTYTLDLDRANQVLRQTASGTDYNANRNLGIIEQLKVALARVPVWMTAMTAFYGTINGFQAMGTEILKVDQALTELRRVADDGINIDYIFKGAVDLSQQLGNNVHDVMQTMNDFARTFGDFNERQLIAITRTATLMSNVSDLTSQEAGESLIGTMNAFNIEAEESLRIVDAFNEVDNNFAISTKQLAEGMSKGASTAKTFGVEMEESIGHITAIGAVTMESGKVIGNSLKTIYSRITTIDDAKSVLEDVGVALYDIHGNVLPVNDILADLAGRWGTLSDHQRQNIAVTTAGRYQLSRFLALMNNWQMSVDATATAYTSSGSAMRENNEYLKSFQARINELKNVFTELSLAVGEAFMGGAMSAGIDVLTGLARVATDLVNTFGGLPIILGVVGMLMRTFGMFKGSISGTVATLRILGMEFGRASAGMGVFRGGIAGTSATITMLRGSLAGATVAVNGLKFAFRSFLASTVIGAVFVAIGYGLEKLIGYFQKQKQVAEETEKANKTLVDSYRNTEGGLDNLIKKHEELQSKVDSGAIEEGTEAYNEYLKVNQQVADALPTLVKYVDSNGVAHLESADAMREEYKIAEMLSDEYAKMDELEFEGDVQKRVKAIQDLGKEVEKLAKKRKELEEQDGKTQSVYMGYGDSYSYTADNSKEIQKNKIEAVKAYQDIQKQIQGINIEIKETVMSSLEADKILKGLTDTQIGAIESFVTQNEHILQKTANQLRDGKITQEEFAKRITEQTNEMYDAGVKVGEIINTKSKELIDNATVGLIDEAQIGEKTAEIKNEFDMLIKSLPTTFFKVESLKNVDQFQEKLDGVLGVANKIEGGAFDFESLTTELQNQGLTVEQAQGMVISLGYQYDNASIKAEALRMKEEGLTDSLQGYIDVALEATDATANLFGINDTDISSLQTHIETLQGLKLVYGENASEMDAWKTSIEQVSWFLGVEEEKVKENLGHYQQVLSMLPNLTLKYDELGNAVGFDTEQLNDNQKAILNKMIANGEEGKILDLLTGKTSTLTGETIEDTEAKKGNTEATKENAEAKKIDEQATQQLTDKFKILKGETNTVNKSAYIDGIRQQLESLDGKITVTKDKVTNELKLAMADGSESSYLNTLQTQLSELGIKVGLTEDEAGNLKLVLNDGTGSTTLTQIDQDAEDAKLSLDKTVTSMDIIAEKSSILPNNFSQINFSALAGGLDTAFQKVDLLTGALDGTAENILGATTKAEEFANKLSNIAQTSDTIMNNATSFNVVKDAVDDLITSLLTAQEKIGGIFNGLHISDEVAQSIGNASTKIASIGTSAVISNAQTVGLVATLSLLSAVSASSGGIAEYARQLGLLSHNLVLASQYGLGTIATQRALAQSFATVVSIVKSYNIAISNAGAGVAITYTQMANVIAIMTNLMMMNYAKNAQSVGNMKNVIARTLQGLVSEFAQKGTLVIRVMDTMTNQMHKEFKSGMDRIVDTASTVPSRIGKAIRDNMASASSAMDAVAKDMVSRFKKELGIHSPSRVFEDLGMWTIKGLANGLNGEDLKSLGKSVFDDFGGGVFDSWDMIKAYVSGDFSAIAGQAGAGVQQWAGVATKALMMTGQYSPENLQRLLYQMQTESGGNARAINLWDSNAKAGIPSKGLMQVIDPTFNAYKMSGFNNIWNPLDNILASIRYAVSRYGSLARAYRGVGYEVGGFIDEEHLAMVGEGDKREVVIPLEQHRSRALSLWTQAGQELGLGNVVEELKPKRGRGGAGATGGSFGASSGEGGGGEGGSGGTGSSGVMQESIYTGGVNADGGYMFNVLELAELQKGNSLSEREISSWQGTVATLQGQMERMVQNSLAYRNALKQVNFYQNKILSNTQKELDATVKRNSEVNKRLKELGNTSKHTEKQREEYNKLQQEYDSNLSKIAQLKGEVQSLTNDIRAKSIEIFTNFIDEIVGKYDTAIEGVKKKVDDTDFKLEVLSITDPENTAKQLDLLGQKARELAVEEATSLNKRKDLQAEYDKAVKKYGATDERTKHVLEQLDEANEAYEDSFLARLNAEKEIEDVRGDIADKGIDQLKDYYGNMKDLATKALEAERKELEKNHTAKMEMYDKEIEKINSVYDAKLKEMDKEKAQAEYQEQLDEKNLKRTELMNKISLLSRDTSLEGRRKVDELKAELETLNGEISDLQKERADELLREQLEAQKQAQIDALEAKKESEQTSYDSAIEGIDQEKTDTEQHYDDLLNNESYWDSIRNDFINGDVSDLTIQLKDMQRVIKEMSKGNFDNLTNGFADLSDEAKRAFMETNAVAVSNMGFGTDSLIDQVQGGGVNYNPYTGKGTDFSTGKETTWSEPKPPSTSKPSTGGSSSTGTKYHTIKKGDNFWDLENKYGLSHGTLAKLNPNVNPNKLQIGSKIVISKGSSSSSNSKPSTSTSSGDRKTVSALNMRTSPSYGNNVSQVLPKGAVVDYIGMERGWAKIKYKGKTGYVGASYLQKFDTGGYTGDWAGNEGKVAMLHKKENVLNEKQTEHIFNTAKLLDKLQGVVPALQRSSVANKLAMGTNINTNISYGDIIVNVENGDKKKARDIAGEIVKGLKKKGK